MISEKLEKALNVQINAEYYSSYLYLSMSSYFDAKGLPGMSNWMRMQAQEEMIHAMKIYDYVLERSGRVLLVEIEAPQTEWDSALEVFEESYAHEQKVTGMINELVSLSLAEKDYAAESFLQWFVDEQVEEEASVTAVLDQLRLVGDNGMGLFMIDGQLAQRQAPAAPAADGA